MTARLLSVAFSVASVLFPAAIIVYAHRYVQAQFELVGPAPVEGKAIAGAFMLLIPASVLLCLIGLVIGFIGYRRLPPPRSLLRKLEVAALALPILLWLLLAKALFVWVLDAGG